MRISQLGVSAHGEFLVTSDILGQLNLFRYFRGEKSLKHIARSHEKWNPYQLCLFNETTILASTFDGDLWVCRNAPRGDADQERASLLTSAHINLNEAITWFETGSTPLDTWRKDPVAARFLKNVNSLSFALYSTVFGTVGIVTQIPQKLYELLLDLQESLIRLLESPEMPFKYRDWRGEQKDLQRLIDGDLLRRLSGLSKADIDTVLTGMTTVEKPKYEDLLDLLDWIHKLV
eukprot:TRINITY_DN8060_c0_g1_i2.p1 TRINITY_DN8060_c0_g1~~TRINITY_DN8060_c0_g1_i2.p1  ORF type:complete len:233 (-),score=57.60 TRINITY_DN8060_c0_g1_i2:126-824(-)